MEDLARFVHNHWVVAQFDVLPRHLMKCPARVLTHSEVVVHIWVRMELDFVDFVVCVDDLVVVIRFNIGENAYIQIAEELLATNLLAFSPPFRAHKLFESLKLLCIPGLGQDSDVVVWALLPCHVPQHRFDPADGVDVADIKNIL